MLFINIIYYSYYVFKQYWYRNRRSLVIFNKFVNVVNRSGTKQQLKALPTGTAASLAASEEAAAANKRGKRRGNIL